MILSEVPNEEIVIGVAGRFLRPDGGRRSHSRVADQNVGWNFLAAS